MLPTFAIDHVAIGRQAFMALDAGIRLALDFYVHGSRLRYFPRLLLFLA